MIRIAILATRLLLCSATAAVAQPAPPGNLVGGGEVRMTGSGDEAAFTRLGPATSQAGRPAQLLGGQGAGPEVGYLAPVPPGERGRSALLMGSGDEAVLAYGDGLTGAPRARG